MKIKQAHGFSMLEVLVALAILMVFSLGILEMYKSSISLKTQGVTRLQVDQIRSQLAACVLSAEAWKQTINSPGNPELGCLRNPTATCPVTPPPAPSIRLLDAKGNPCLQNATPGSGPAFYDAKNNNHGFTKDGIFCDASANPDCLIRPNVQWRPIPCAMGPCPNPTSAVDITFTMFAGRTGGNFALNLSLYNQTVIRGNDFTKNEYILLTEEMPSGTNAGSCKVAEWRDRMINTKRSDDYGNVTLTGSGHMLFKAGTYSCNFYAPGFRVNRHQARLKDRTANLVRIWGSNQFSIKNLAGSMTQSVGKGLFTLTTDSDLVLEHNCPAADSNNKMELGAALGIDPAVPEVYSIMECYRRN